MKAHWFKLHHDIINDIKMRRFSIQEKWAWVVILCLASQSSDRGSIIADDEDIADACGYSNVQDWLYFKDKLRTKGMVEPCEGGLTITNWEQRQYENPSDAPNATRERKRQQRDRQKTANVTASHECVTTMSRPVTHRGEEKRREEIREDHTACVLNGELRQEKNPSQHTRQNPGFEDREEQPVPKAIAQEFIPVNSALDLPRQTGVDASSAPADPEDFLDSLMIVSVETVKVAGGYIHPAQKMEDRFRNPNAHPWTKDKNLLKLFLQYLCNTYGNKDESKERKMAIATGMVRKANYATTSSQEYQRINQSWLLFRENAIASTTVEEATAAKPKVDPRLKAFYERMGNGMAERMGVA